MLNYVIPVLIGFAEISVFWYFFYVTLYNLILSLAGHFKSPIINHAFGKKRNYLILIPAYKEDQVIEQTVVFALNLNYSKSHFKIAVIADSFAPQTLEKLKRLPVMLLPYSIQKPTKVKAIRFALESIQESFDAMVILDADNHIDPHFLSNADQLLDQSNRIVQGKRIIKNPESDMAYLDGLSEAINTHINRKGSFNLGLSSSIAGSGFVVDFGLAQSIFRKLDSVGGFDKDFELQAALINCRTAYSDHLIVYDEKVETNKTFKSQRRRWISSQYAFLWKNFIIGIKSLFKGDYIIFNTVILRNLQLPRLLNLGLFLVVLITGFYFYKYLLIDSLYWSILFILFVVTILISIPGNYYSKRLMTSLLRLPSIFWMMLLLMFGLRGANKSFIHTPHGSNTY